MRHGVLQLTELTEHVIVGWGTQVLQVKWKSDAQLSLALVRGPRDDLDSEGVELSLDPVPDTDDHGVHADLLGFVDPALHCVVDFQMTDQPTQL